MAQGPRAAGARLLVALGEAELPGCSAGLGGLARIFVFSLAVVEIWSVPNEELDWLI